MNRPLVCSITLGLAASFSSSAAFPEHPSFTPGTPGVGDPYFPLDGNGGFDVAHYRLQVQYNPETDRLAARSTATARATQHLSQFNLDLDGLEVSSVSVEGQLASWSHADGELVITPRQGLRAGSTFRVSVEYAGVPQTAADGTGFIHTARGALIVGQPHGASTWFPANDHPSDRAAFTIELTVPEGLEAVANGVLSERRTSGGWTTWIWDAVDPMATYLAGLSIGELEVNAYERDGISYWDAFDADLFAPVAAPQTGDGMAIAQRASLAWQRLSRIITVPEEGAQLSFSVTRSTEEAWDYFFVEAHTLGLDDWTTLPDRGGVATRDLGFGCPASHELHPFLARYQSPGADEAAPCQPAGTSGEWWAASGASDGAERWTVDLSAWAGARVEVSLSHVTDENIQLAGVFVDDIVVSTGEGSTSFEADEDAHDGWVVAGAPQGSPGNTRDWIAGTSADLPPSLGRSAELVLERQPEMIVALEASFGPYPFEIAGGIVSSEEFPALETQTRPIYPAGIFVDGGEGTVVHELAHQWFGDSLTLESWQHIWLNEGFATYAVWLWNEHEGTLTAQDSFDSWWSNISPSSSFWSVPIGDPGADGLFAYAVYIRGAMTLHQLRLQVGDAAFFDIIACWAQSMAGDTVTTGEFITLAEAISGQDLEAFFDEWLFQPARPTLASAAVQRIR